MPRLFNTLKPKLNQFIPGHSIKRSTDLDRNTKRMYKKAYERTSNFLKTNDIANINLLATKGKFNGRSAFNGKSAPKGKDLNLLVIRRIAIEQAVIDHYSSCKDHPPQWLRDLNLVLHNLDGSTKPITITNDQMITDSLINNEINYSVVNTTTYRQEPKIEENASYQLSLYLERAQNEQDIKAWFELLESTYREKKPQDRFDLEQRFAQDHPKHMKHFGTLQYFRLISDPETVVQTQPRPFDQSNLDNQSQPQWPSHFQNS